MSDSTSMLFIPDTLRDWPWPRRLNPNYSVCKEESAAWCESFRAFSPKAQDAFNRCDFSLLASLSYPLLDKAGCRVACDLMILFFIIDEHTDAADDKGARMMSDIIMDAIHNPYTPRPTGEWIGGEVARQFWHNAIKIASPNSQRRFVDSFQKYLDAVVSQAVDRTADHIRSVDDYFAIRRRTIGIPASLPIYELYMSIPDDIMNHPVIMKLAEQCADIVAMCNDLHSYNVEQARGDEGHNLVTVVMRQFDMDVHSSLEWVSKHCVEVARQFVEEWQKIPTFGGPIDREVRIYCDGIASWVRGYESWAFECERYFGKDGPLIRESRQVRKLPKATPEELNDRPNQINLPRGLIVGEGHINISD